MKLIIAGSSHFDDENKILDIINEKIAKMDINPKEIEVVCGTAEGVDTHGETWALSVGAEIAYFPAEWSQYGKRAGHLRNKDMAEYCDQALIIWDGKSPGSNNMIWNMKNCGKPYIEVIC